MEKRHLVKAVDDQPLKASSYGSVNLGDETTNCIGCRKIPEQIESSFNDKAISTSSSARSCSCLRNFGGQCDCDVKEKGIQFEPWARYKTITMVVGLSLFIIWIIIITLLGKMGKL